MSAEPVSKRSPEEPERSPSPLARHKRRKQAAPSRAPPPPAASPPAGPPLADLHAKMADIYKNALAFSAELALPPFDPLAAYRLLPRAHDPPRIFNPEAYCDLCCKEFCNKYFLKTHRANKHGIYEAGAGDEPRPEPPRRASDEESGAGTPRRLSPDSCRRARDAGFGADALRRLGVLNPEAFCEICCKEYCNKYFLRTHRERRHGAPPASPPPPALAPAPPATPPPAPSPPLEAPPVVKCEREEEECSRDGQTSPLNLIVEERAAGGGGSPGSASEELRKLQTMISQLNELAAERLEAETEPGPPPDSRPPSGEPPAAADERRAAGSSFCEICNKELCNKYFMRTHMQRMHGISLEGGAQLGGVTCDICHKELCSKYFLRVHKHNTHGVPAPPAPGAPPAHQPEQCPLCSRRFRAPRALRAHLLAEHAPPGQAPPPAPVAPPPPEQPLDLLADQKPYGCSYCPFTTNVLAFLFAHERAHAHAQQAGARAPGGAEREEAPPGAGAEPEGFSCSRCEFRAGAFAEMEAHLRAAHGAGGGALLAVPRAPAPLTMQPFVLEEQAAGGGAAFVPSLVFLPVRRRATRRATVTFTLTPA